jgi:hypothetical protein
LNSSGGHDLRVRGTCRFLGPSNPTPGGVQRSHGDLSTMRGKRAPRLLEFVVIAFEGDLKTDQELTGFYNCH